MSKSLEVEPAAGKQHPADHTYSGKEKAGGKGPAQEVDTVGAVASPGEDRQGEPAAAAKGDTGGAPQVEGSTRKVQLMDAEPSYDGDKHENALHHAFAPI